MSEEFKEKKSWKDLLLSSGLPLEYSVRESLRALGFPAIREYTYERTNEAGVSVPFSVDICASRPCGLDLAFWLDMLVECKYRHSGTKWLFFPEPEGPFMPGLADALVTVEPISGREPIDGRRVYEYAKPFPLCSKGVEILPKEANPKAIRQGIQQLRFGLVDRVGTVIEEQFSPLPSSEDVGWVVVPVLVTTADIWCVNRGLALEHVRDAEHIEDVAAACSVALLRQEPDPELRNHAVARLLRAVPSDTTERLAFAMSARGFGDYADFVRSFAQYYPCFFFIVQYEALWDFARGLLGLVDPLGVE